MINNMKKRLNKALKNKGGFTLVELIVVIVIILILAAVLVPNVYKYISQASAASCKQDAASALTQLQADVAWDITVEEGAASDATGALAGEDYKIAGTAATLDTDAAASAAADGADGFYYTITDDEITAFGYNNGTHYVTWTQADGWGEVQ